MYKIVSAKELKIVRQGNEILKGIDFEMNDDQHIAVIGPNGAGKSFLLQILSADSIPSSGTVKIFGQEFGKVSLLKLRQQIGFVSNRMFYAFEEEMTCLEVVCTGFTGFLGLPDGYTEEQATRAKKMLKFFKVDYLAERKFTVVSDGERRKIMLSRAIVNEPKLLILDEPCQGLDIASREIFLNDVNKLAEKIPLIYVTHHLEELPSCISDLILIKDGKVFDNGKKNDILNSDKISRLFDCDLEVIKKGDRYYTLHK